MVSSENDNFGKIENREQKTCYAQKLNELTWLSISKLLIRLRFRDNFGERCKFKHLFNVQNSTQRLKKLSHFFARVEKFKFYVAELYDLNLGNIQIYY